MLKFISKETLIGKINTYLGESKISLDVSQIGREHMVELKYRDFESQKKVRRTIEKMGDNVTVVNIERLFSDAVLLEALYEMMPEDCDLYVKIDDSFVPTTPLVAVEDYLLNRSYHK